MRKWILAVAFVAAPASAQEQCEAYRTAELTQEMQFIPSLAAPPNAYVGISYNSESLVQVRAEDLSSRKVKVVKKTDQETCECFKMITDHCRTIYVPVSNKRIFTFIDAFKHGMLFVIPEKKANSSAR